MKPATYRIVIEHTPGDMYPYYARVYTLNDATFPVHTCHASTEASANIRCREWVAAQAARRPQVTLFVDDAGEDGARPPGRPGAPSYDAGHSVRV